MKSKAISSTAKIPPDGVILDNNIGYNSAANNVIGGPAPDQRNIISGNGWYGIEMSGQLSTGNSVQGNFIGPDASGILGLSNTRGRRAYHRRAGQCDRRRTRNAQLHRRQWRAGN